MNTRFRPWSARTRILGAIMVVAAVGLALVGAITFSVHTQRETADVQGDLNEAVHAMQAIAGDTAPHEEGDPVPPEIVINTNEPVEVYLRAVLTVLQPEATEGAAAVLSTGLVLTSDAPDAIDITEIPGLVDQIVKAVKTSGEAEYHSFSSEQGLYQYMGVPVSSATDPTTGTYIRVINVTQRLDAVTSLLITYVLAALAILVGLAIIGWFVAGQLLAPIRDLSRTASTITLSDLRGRIPSHGKDDISELTRIVNAMLDRLEGSVEAQRRLLDDVRHELKAPLTIIRGHLEMTDATDPEDVEQTRAISLGELDRLNRLVEDIDQLAAVDGGKFEFSDLNVRELTDQIGELVSAIPNHEWTVSSRADVVVRADHDRLLQSWLQLAENAGKYTPPYSPIEVGSNVEEGHVRMWVRDHGEGIPETSRQHVFERFARGRTSRQVGGTGLGLAIVTAIMQAHSGTCVVTDTPNGGATFTMIMPVVTPPYSPALASGDSGEDSPEEANPWIAS